jgi:hypothetical protein
MKLIDKLPTSYDQINYKTYIQIIQTLPDSKPDDWSEDEYNSFLHLAPLSILLDVPMIDLERLPATELMPMIERVQFMAEPFKQVKTSLKLKTVKELTYDEFVSYQSLRLDQWVNMPGILSIIIKDKTPEEIDQLNINEVMQCFFMLNKSTMKLLLIAFQVDITLFSKAALYLPKLVGGYIILIEFQSNIENISTITGIDLWLMIKDRVTDFFNTKLKEADKKEKKGDD